jgi:hypothetical protein
MIKFLEKFVKKPDYGKKQKYPNTLYAIRNCTCGYWNFEALRLIIEMKNKKSQFRK